MEIPAVASDCGICDVTQTSIMIRMSERSVEEDDTVT